MLEVGSCSITQVLVVALITVIILYMIYGRSKKYKLPPGPWQLPIFGNLLNFAFSKKEVLEQLTELAEKFGPIYSLKFFNMKVVVLNDMSVVNEAMLTKPTDFAGRVHSYTADIVTEGGKDIALADIGPTWRLQRKIASTAFRKYLSGPQLEERVHGCLGGIIELIKTEKGAFDPKMNISLLIMNFISSFCFGKSYGPDDPEVAKLLSLTDTFLNSAPNGLPEDYIPFLRHFHLPGSRKLLEALQVFLDHLYGLYEEHEKTFDANNIRDFTDCVLAAELEAQKEESKEELSKLTKTHFVQLLSDIFGAGLDTSRFTLLWAVYHCCLFPEAQEKAYSQIVDNVGKSDFPKIADKKRLPYVDAVLYESLRMASLTPVGVPHAAMLDSSIGGYDIPKGTLVLINHLFLHYDKTFWKDPTNFRPERFLEEDGSMAPKPANFLPFSLGRRVCLGESIAKPELFMILASLLQKFKFSLAPGEDGSLKPVGGISTLVPKPFKVIAEERL